VVNHPGRVRKIKAGTRELESPDGAGMTLLSKPVACRLDLALSAALLAACAVNLLLAYCWL
jgi:hypothetical protein